MVQVRTSLGFLVLAASLSMVAGTSSADLLVLDVDGEGSVQEWTYAGGAANFTNVQIDDGDSSYVFVANSNRDQKWSVANSSGQTGTITNLTVHGILRYHKKAFRPDLQTTRYRSGSPRPVGHRPA